MIVLGADTHRRSHTIAAVSAGTGELLGERTVQVGLKRFHALVMWARELGGERVWALEDCRHVSGSCERFLIERGERVLRLTTKLMADSRRRARGRAKSDSIDAIAVARAALREGLDALPAAQLEGPELDLRLLVDHRERLVRQRVALNNTLQWHLHDIWPELTLPGSSLCTATGAHASPAGSRAPSRRRASASPATSCAASASSRGPSRRTKPRSVSWSPRSRRSCCPSPGSGRDSRQTRRRDRRRRPLRQRRQARTRRRRRSDPRQLSQHQPPPPRPRRQPPDQRDHPPHRRHPPAPRHRNTALQRPQTRPRQDPPRSIRCLKRHLTRRLWHLLQPPTPGHNTIKLMT